MQVVSTHAFMDPCHIYCCLYNHVTSKMLQLYSAQRLDSLFIQLVSVSTVVQNWSQWPDTFWRPQGAWVQLEGRRRGHFWTFDVVRAGRMGGTISLVRCSTTTYSTFEKWLTVSLHAWSTCSADAFDKQYSISERQSMGALHTSMLKGNS